MLVYRYIGQGELKHIMKGEIGKIGMCFTEKLDNTFVYDKDIKYIHFFKDYNSMNYIRKIHFKKDDKFYFCTFDIPSDALTSGVGEYHSEDYKGCIKLDEFILEAKKLKPHWFVEAKADDSREEAKKQDEEVLTNFLIEMSSTGEKIGSEKELFEN